MGRITQEDIERVRDATDFVQIASEDVVLKRAGRKFKACCPFHEEKTPSFQIDPDLKLWHCFGCGEGGDVFDYVGRIHHLDFPDSVRYLADRAHIELAEVEGGVGSRPKGHKDRLLAVCSATEGFYHHELMRSSSNGAARARAYLSGRGFGSSVCKRWHLGFAPGRGALHAALARQGFSDQEMIDANVVLRTDAGKVRDRFYERIMFPIHDRFGKTIAFGGRVVGSGEPKYLNSSETPLFHKSSNLFAIERAKDSIASEAEAIVVEGYTDAITLHEAGITNVVATLGTALTQQHVKTLRSLRPKRIIYLFDGDSAGQKAADRATEFIDGGITAEAGRDYVEFLVTVLPDDSDPSDFVRERGADALRELLDQATPLVRFAIDRRLDAWDLTNPGQREQALVEAVSLLAPIKTSLVATDYANYIADRLHVDTAPVMRALERAKPQVQRRASVPRQQADAPTRRPRPESRKARTERELLTLLASRPRLLAEADIDLKEVSWSNDVAQQVADALVAPDAPASGSDFIGQVTASVPEAAQYLSGGTLEVSSAEEAVELVRTLYLQIRESELRDSIRSATIYLKNLPDQQGKAYKNTFEKISMLQQELKELRKRQTSNRP
jgi:DNA primase